MFYSLASGMVSHAGRIAAYSQSVELPAPSVSGQRGRRSSEARFVFPHCEEFLRSGALISKSSTAPRAKTAQGGLLAHWSLGGAARELLDRRSRPMTSTWQ